MNEERRDENGRILFKILIKTECKHLQIIYTKRNDQMLKRNSRVEKWVTRENWKGCVMLKISHLRND